MAIIMATYEPNEIFLQKQIDSLKAQEEAGWICHIVDDYSSETTYAKIVALVKDDARFLVRRNSENRGSARTFLEALERVEPTSEFVFYCDQDDIWLPRKLRVMLENFEKSPRVALIHSDAKLIDSNDLVFAESCWKLEKRRNPQTLSEVIFRNHVTGCTCGFRSSLIPFLFKKNSQKPEYFHDHWTAAHGFLNGGIGFVAEPLVHYRQHQDNLIGAQQSGGLLSALAKGKLSKRLIKSYLIRKTLTEDLVSSLKTNSDEIQRLQKVWSHFGLLSRFLFKMSLHGRVELRQSLQVFLGYLLFRKR